MKSQKGCTLPQGQKIHTILTLYLYPYTSESHPTTNHHHENHPKPNRRIPRPHPNTRPTRPRRARNHLRPTQSGIPKILGWRVEHPLARHGTSGPGHRDGRAAAYPDTVFVRGDRKGPANQVPRYRRLRGHPRRREQGRSVSICE